jgi:uncharacterized circularly permuted ATP-grasp superfamily protein/uncharacterized alpha-E superfamily protein
MLEGRDPAVAPAWPDLPAAVLQMAQPGLPGRFDELRAAAARLARPGTMPDAWAQFFTTECPHTTAPERPIDALAAKLDRVQASVQREVHANGITYNVYSADAGQQRPWSLDPLPWIIGSDDWSLIERGVLQRAQLLNRLMADVYGPQTFLHEGLLPSALVHGHPGYLRALRGWQAREGSWLQLVAFDLTRQPDGQWAVVSQRPQAPSGLGYLLENRMIVSRQFPAAFALLKVQRLAGAYRAWMDNLYRLSPQGDRSCVVLLTPGPYNETYFEHAFLARYLGIPLVEGTDLMVRDERVYLKSLHGLEPVHGILRRLDDDYCDPLELRSDSTIGVPGLVQAVRAGQVAVFNSLGAGFLESPAINGFLPSLCERWMGEALRLPSLDTWWCGEAAARAQLMPDLRQCVIKPTTPQVPVEARPLHDVSEAELDALRRQIDLAPGDFTAQRYSPLSAVPVWCDLAHRRSPEPPLALRPALLRVYALADGPGSWRLLPGGLGRTAAPGRELVSMQRGGSSVDVWAITRTAVDASTLLPAALSVADLRSRHRTTTSRAAENLFWLGRYTERAENATRLAREVLEWLAGRSHRFAPLDAAAGSVLAETAAQGLAPRLAAMLGAWAQRFGLVNLSVPTPSQSQRLFERALAADLLDPAATSLAFNLRCLRACAEQVRDRLSREHWRLVDEAMGALRIDPSARVGTRPVRAADVLGLLDGMASRLAAITGAQVDRMTRDDGWRMLSLGRQIERTQFVCGVLQIALSQGVVGRQQARVADEESDAMFDLLLGVCDCRITYRSLYQRRRELLPMLDLLVKDADNPRSLAWVVRTLGNRVARLPPSRGAAWPSALTDWTQVDAASLEELQAWWDLPASAGSTGADSQLEDWLNQLSDRASSLSDAVSERYFSHATGSALDEVTAELSAGSPGRGGLQA